MKITGKEQFLNALAVYEFTDLFLTERTDLLHEEIFHNCLSISIKQEQTSEISANDIVLFLSKVKANRQAQLNINPKTSLIYYLWFDEMAGQLRFNFINSNHTKLPFECNLNFVKDEREIVNSFLQSQYLNGIPQQDLSDEMDATVEQITESESEIFTLDVYQQLIRADIFPQ